MKLSIYKIYAFLFLITVNGFSQTKEVLIKKSFMANESTVLNLDIDNIAVVLEESFDEKIHFDYTIIFGNYSKRKREMIKNQSKTTTRKNNNEINLEVRNSEFLRTNIRYELDFNSDGYLTSFKDFIKFEKSKKNKHKTKDSILKEIALSEGNSLTNFMKKNIDNLKQNKSLITKKAIIQKFIIKVPKNTKIRIKAIQSNITFKYDIIKPFVMNSFKGVFKFKKILAKENKIISSNGVFQAEKVTNARLEFIDMSKVLIGEVSYLDLATETSKIEIGEVGKSVVFNDFNSKLFFYNFSTNFNQFKYKGEYSKLSFYNIKNTNFSMNVFGHNTSLNMNEIKTTFGISKDKKLDKILEMKVKKGKISSGKIDIELVNGILNIK